MTRCVRRRVKFALRKMPTDGTVMRAIVLKITAYPCVEVMSMRTLIQRLVLAIVLAGFAIHAQAQTQVVAPLPYVTGGIGLDEREALLKEAKAEGYNLKVVTAATVGAYLANVSVRIEDRRGATVLEGAMDGPWFFAKLPPGQYTVSVSDGQQKQKQTVQISDKGMREVIFRWKRADNVQGIEW